jgi:carbohydrate-selective porin OprB
MDSTPTAAYLGSTDAALQFDLRKMMKIGRGKIVVTSQWLQGHTINDSEVGAAQRMSNLDAEPFCKVIEAYYADTYLHERLTVKLGRQYADKDFNVVEAGGYFLNSSYGLNPTIPLPTFPEPQLGASVWVLPKKWISVGGGIYQNKTLYPAPPYPVDSELSLCWKPSSILKTPGCAATTASQSGDKRATRNQTHLTPTKYGLTTDSMPPEITGFASQVPPA